MADQQQVVTLSHTEASQLYRLMRYEYLNVNTYPALGQFWSRLETWADANGFKDHERPFAWRVP